MSLQKNEAQEEAIKTIKGPVIVISCPGSGKTTTLVRRIKHIIDNGGNPKKILMITFANSAAADMQERYVKLYGKNPGIMFMTIHSLCFNILRIEKGYDSSSLITESQKMEFLVNQLKGNIYIDDAWEMAKTIATEISAVRNSYTPLKNFIPTGCDKELFVRVYNAYEQEKRNSGKIDFDDMLVKCEELLSTNKEIRDKWSRHFDYIQVDEYQDTNQIQKDIIYTLISRTNNLCVVGDDDQSLYSWRGADPSIMMNFSEDFPKVKVINMSTNYRSSQKIIDYADTLIKRNKKRFQKNFISFRGQNGSVGEVHFLESKGKRNEMAAIIDKIHYLHEVENYDYNEMAILFRTNKQAEIPVDMLSRAGLPFSSTEKIKTVYESYIFKDIRAYVELSLGMNYKSNLFAVLNHPNRYLHSQQFLDIPYREDIFLQAIESLRHSKDTWRYPAAEKSIKGWFASFGPNKISLQTSPSEIFKLMESKDKINYKKHLKNIASMKNEDVESELEIFEMLKEDVTRFETVESWLNHAKYMVAKTKELNRKRSNDGIQLATMHKSKGLEWKVVFLIGVDDKVLPGKLVVTDDGREEERRVLYVGMTRAMDILYISSSGTQSKFLIELKEDYKGVFNPTIKKKLPGAKVTHSEYGLGKVVRYSDNAIIINFEKVGLKKLLFPDVFKKGYCRYL